jgi:hypothetical protein
MFSWEQMKTVSAGMPKARESRTVRSNGRSPAAWPSDTVDHHPYMPRQQRLSPQPALPQEKERLVRRARGGGGLRVHGRRGRCSEHSPICY